MLSDPRLDDLVNLIKDSFRVQPNKQPVYVETSNNLHRVRSRQHQVIFGRRGSGKSCLLVTSHLEAKTSNILSIYVNADSVKRLSYPDLLIRLLIQILDSFPGRIRVARVLPRVSLAAKTSRDLRLLLDEADVQQVARQVANKQGSNAKVSASLKGIGAQAGDSRESSSSTNSEYVQRKLDYLERHQDDYRRAIEQGLRYSRRSHAALIIDDFYLIPSAIQPFVVDYLHSLVRGTDCYLKVGTIRHRSRLLSLQDGQTIGIEASQDFESIDLDQTFENVNSTREYLRAMLDSMGGKVGITGASELFLTSDALLALTLASGGVPRDYLNIFVEAVGVAKSSGNQIHLTATPVYKGAARDSYRTKLRNFREDAGAEFRPLEHLYNDLSSFCLSEKKKTAFLISEREAQSDALGHELIRQLMDLKLIHVIEPDTSAASGRPGRYEAYTLDFAGFMEPRKRNIEIVEFWKADSSSRPKGVREAPVYSLARGRSAAEQTDEADEDSPLGDESDDE